ncbi:HK97 gp10 family phage protein [Paraliobacillus sp. X-1268]|uniref:HK97 gp10 family phage protein n=1 Tax=Paraliobacillus sp. X-1268 TaxID=2213193 RepID=UPI000E3D0645|nr:HK97 gp10 family phage protein [Paraliobacillus sp. X-1268]
MAKSKFKQAKKEMRKRRETVAKTVALFAEAESKIRTPVKTGNLRRGITHEIQHEDDRSIAVVGSNVEYDAVIELGSEVQNIQAQPHHRPAITENIGRLNKMINDGLNLK